MERTMPHDGMLRGVVYLRTRLGVRVAFIAQCDALVDSTSSPDDDPARGLSPAATRSNLTSEVEAAQAYSMYQKGALYLEGRTQEEGHQGHIRPGIPVPPECLEGRRNERPQDKHVVVVCRRDLHRKEGTSFWARAALPGLRA
jgi:hypothetical protein